MSANERHAEGRWPEGERPKTPEQREDRFFARLERDAFLRDRERAAARERDSSIDPHDYAARGLRAFELIKRAANEFDLLTVFLAMQNSGFPEADVEQFKLMASGANADVYRWYRHLINERADDLGGEEIAARATEPFKELLFL